MKGMGILPFAGSYLKKNRAVMVSVISGGVICGAVFWLYRLPVEAVAYAVFLGLVPGGLLAAGGFLRYCRKCRDLERMAGRKGGGPEPFPKTDDAAEALYQRLLKQSFEERERILCEEEEKRSEMNDYYTMWVHQVKTPIAAMNLILQTGEGPDNGRLSQELFKIEQYAEMVLQYLRTDSPSADLVIRECRLDDIIRKAIHKYAPVFIRQKIGLDYSPVSCLVVTDEKWLLFVIEQLLSNALKYTDEGKITIRMETGRRTLVIEDTGRGIASEDIPRVFEKGYTGSNGRNNQRSTGIGLYLCKKIMTRLSHEMEIESEPGVGTKVRIHLEEKKFVPE